MNDEEKREKVIKGLECHVQLNELYCRLCPYYEDISAEKPQFCTAALANDAIILLKKQEPRVMDADDMWELKYGDVAFLEQKIPPAIFPAIVVDNIKHDSNLEVLQVVTPLVDGTANATYDFYGKMWRCWTAMPTEEQRKAVEWDD